MSETQPELIPGLEEFWTPDESMEGLEREVRSKPPRFATSRPAQYDYGFVYRGPFETISDGVCTAVRRNACALRRSGVPVFLQSPTHLHWNNGVVERAYYSELPFEVLAEVDHITEPKHARTLGWFEHFVPDLAKLIQLTEPGALGADAEIKPSMLKSTAAVVALEHDVIPPSWIERFNMFGRVIVPCHANEEWLRASGIQVPVHVVVHPLSLKDPIRRVPKAAFKGGTFCFLHVGKWEPRKNQHVLIGAFLREFDPSDNVQLILKCNPYWSADGYPPTAQASIDWWLKRPDIAKKWGESWSTCRDAIVPIWKQQYTREEMTLLYSKSHAYVQSGRSEGFDLCALDAKIAGLRMVGVFWGGPSQFHTPEDDIQIGWTARVIPPKGYQAPDGVLWPDPPVSFYAHALRKAFDRRNEPVPSFDAKPYLIDSVGAQFREIATEMAAYVGVDLREMQAK